MDSSFLYLHCCLSQIPKPEEQEAAPGAVQLKAAKESDSASARWLDLWAVADEVQGHLQPGVSLILPSTRVGWLPACLTVPRTPREQSHVPQG